MKVLILGISGGIARNVAFRLQRQGHEVFGIDARPWPGAPRGLDVYLTDIRKRAAEEVFRRRRPDAVVHMATVTALSVKGEERGRINLGGTQAVFNHCQTYGVRHAVFVGRHTFYGAAPDAPLYHTEDEPPRALQALPELVDLVAADLFASMALWRTPKLDTAVLRLCYTLGTPGTGTLATFLRPPRVPMLLGYDPLFHFLHEDDAAAAIGLALEKRLRGIYNVAGPQPLPLSIIIRNAGRTAIPVPGPLLRRLIGRFGFPDLPVGAIDHLRYPIVIDSGAFRTATGFAPRYDEVQTLEGFRASQPS